MSAQQPEALRIACDLRREWSSDALNYDTALDAAAELCRLHAEVERLRKLVPDVELAREAIYGKAGGREA